MQFKLEGDFVRLGDLIKLAGLVGTGGEAKQVVQDGKVKLDGVVCTERGKKIRPGAKVFFKGETIEVVSA